MDPEECPLVRVVAPPRCEVLLLDVLPNSAPLVQSLEEEILRRTKGTMHFSQPEGNLWRAQISGAPDALQEVITFLTDTVGSEAVTVVGFRAAEFPEEDFEIYGAMDRDVQLNRRLNEVFWAFSERKTIRRTDLDPVWCWRRWGGQGEAEDYIGVDAGGNFKTAVLKEYSVQFSGGLA